MSKSDLEKIKAKIPKIEDKRDKTKKSKSLLISNYEYLDKVIDKKEIQERIKEKEEQLHNPFYSIDLNTNKVKQNKQLTFILDMNKTIHNISDAEDIDRQLHNEYLKLMQNVDEVLDDYLDKEYKTFNKLDKDIVQFNIFYDTNYYNGFNLRIKDYLDADVKKDYINQYADAIASLQLQEIKDNFKDIKNLLDVDIDNTDITTIINKKWFKEVQNLLKKHYKDLAEKNQDIDLFIFNAIKERLYKEQIKLLDETIKKHNDYYTKVNTLYKSINKKILIITNKFKDRLDLLKIAKDNDFDIDTNTKDLVRVQTKLPPTISIDFDIMKLFNNIYPNYKFKSIDDNRHKEIDIKAELMFDLDLENPNNMEDLRLINFIKSGNIQLFPIQSALINGFVSIRDVNNDADKTIPLLSTLKYITENKKLRLPTNKKDLRLYEEFMLFFNRCKIQIKIINRYTNDVYFELLKPIPLLANTPAIKDNNYGYIIGNSVINILKNELDSIYSTPRQTTHQISKEYLNAKLPSTPPYVNSMQTIYPMIASMINTYQKKKTYQPKINITSLYDFQALYNKHPKPTKEDKRDARDILNKTLDAFIKKGLIVSYTPIQKGKEINTYKIEINKKAKI